MGVYVRGRELNRLSGLNRWFRANPRATRISIAASSCATLFLVAGWSKFFFLAPGTLIDFGTSAIATLVSLLVVLLSFGIGTAGGLVQLLFLKQRRGASVSFLYGVAPLLVYLVILWSLQNLKGISFD